METGSGKSLVMLKSIDLFNLLKEKNRSILNFYKTKKYFIRFILYIRRS